jgi:NadR type nicotinamide-nucleotide adenylyltransferase
MKLKRFGLGVVIGKFLPFHRGHRLVIETAVSQCDRVEVLVCKRPSDPIPVDVRVDWIRALCPSVHVQVLDQEALGLADSDSPAWAKATIDALGRAPDAAFTSEDYGDPWCKAMGAEHVLVDKPRIRVPISGTDVRKAPLEHLEMLDPEVRAYFQQPV